MSNHTIKFTHAPDGEIEYNKGHTIFSDSFVLGAFALTSKYKFTDGSVNYEFATDTKGLNDLIIKSNETLEFLQDSIVALGLVMTDNNNNQVQENFTELAWLSTGLAELSTMVAKNLTEMNSTLRLLKVDETKALVENH